MGIGIAKCIQRAGHELTVWNRTPAKSKQFDALGAHTAPTIREVSETAEIIITSLMDDASILDVVKTKDGMLEGMSSGAIHACVTTISPTCADELERVHREHGSIYVSAPVIGRPDAAASGRLVSLLAGPSAALKRLFAICKSYSESIVDVAERPRLANVMKLAVNYNVASTIEMISETYLRRKKRALS
jgi:3-hydroxyisobutyrate dehydrogenase-like beta-hydroxyacid dehydrogenase